MVEVNIDDTIIQKAYDLAYKYEAQYGACSQATIRALEESLNESDPFDFKVMSGFAAGVGCEGDGICGGYAAGTFFLSKKYGRLRDDLDKDPKDPSAEKILFKTFGLVKKLHDKFIEKYGSIICHSIHRKLYGRPYYIRDKDELAKFLNAGAHDWGCPSVCGESAKWTLEIINDYIQTFK